ncbi:MAG: hypothetical protein K0R98_1529 [Rickettsiaceae bacterium]|jgi:predicted outer membrane protein|nr:hypothetical protein [Rickettsiaceae bacterium]
MVMKTHKLIIFSMLGATILSGCQSHHKRDKQQANITAVIMTEEKEQLSFEKMLADWPERPRFVAYETIKKYGMPQQYTNDKLVWKKPGAFKRIVICKEEIVHDFPKPHTDFIEHTVEYKVPIDKIDDLVTFNGSNVVNRTTGEISTRSNSEKNNIITLNLNYDIITGKKTAEQARRAYGDMVVQNLLGAKSPYFNELQFTPSDESARFPDRPNIVGAPRRVAAEQNYNDAEILSYIIAIDANAVKAADITEDKPISRELGEYVKMLRTEHGKNAVETMRLGQKNGISPAYTEGVEEFSNKSVGELAGLIQVEGDEFNRAYIDVIIKGHNEALDLIDNTLLKHVSKPALKTHLTNLRKGIVSHLEKAKNLE